MAIGQVDVDRIDPNAVISEKNVITKWFYDIIFFLRERTGGAVDNVNRNIDTITADKTLKGAEGYLVITVSGVTVTMMTNPRIGKPYWFKNTSGGNVTLDGNGKNIDGSSTYVLSTGSVVKFVYDGTGFILFT